MLFNLEVYITGNFHNFLSEIKMILVINNCRHLFKFFLTFTDSSLDFNIDVSQPFSSRSKRIPEPGHYFHHREPVPQNTFAAFKF